LSLRPTLLGLAMLAVLSVIIVTSCLAASIVLIWSAPGDDSLTGAATRYDLRYSTQMITVQNFSQAKPVVNLPPPGAAKSFQLAAVDSLSPGRTYYFAIKSVDHAGNWSCLSNVVTRTPPSIAGVEDALALAFTAPWPNPARSTSRLHWVLPSPMRVQMDVFDISGRRVRRLMDEERAAGADNLGFDLRDDGGSLLAQGIYLVRAQLGMSVFTRRLVVTR